MTREEFDSKIKISKSISELAQYVNEYICYLEQQNTALQARIKEMEEPKTCEGCKHYRTDDDFPYCFKYEHDASFACDRLHFKDMYEQGKVQ